jgi:hypothetical protein
LQASSAPYFVGTKNGFVVTWLTNTNLYFLSGLKTPDAGLPLWALLDDGLFPSPPHAAISVLTRPAAPPVSAARRVKARRRECGVASSFASIHSRRSTASWTGSTSDILYSSSWPGTLPT